MVECFLAKEDVAGSTPVSRSNNLLLLQLLWQHTACNNRVLHPGASGVWGWYAVQGAVPKW